ncbi:strawberry notch-like NTP hydrolase domain-containing protein [Vibrio anguillarum]|uniref:strawberry notch-like NTP hydrolase domain-containing protein n=11 Tax=Vibrio anguillarum TaxID=55601 RepID=UPI0018C23A84
MDQNRLDMLIETGEDKIRVTSISAANIQRNVVTSMSAILLADMHKAHNKTSIDLELLTKLNDNLAALPTASRSDSYRRPLTPAYSLIARQFLEAVDNCDSLTLMNDQAVGLTALIPNELPLKIINHEKSSNNIFTNNHSNEFGKIPTQRMDIGHQAITPGQQIILAANEGVLETAASISGLSITRRDHLEALSVINTMKEDAKTMLIINSDDAFNLGSVELDSFEFHNYVFKNFNVVDAIDIAPILMGDHNENNAKRIYLIDGKKLIPSTTNAPTEINALYSLSDVYQYSNLIVDKFGEKLVRTTIDSDELIGTTSISDILSSYTSNQAEAAKYDLNFAQSRYTPLTSMASANDMAAMPTNFVHASREAAIKLIKSVGNPDQFLMKELGMTKEEIVDAWDAEQIDAITMGIWRLKNGKPFLQGDATGKGKGRTLAAFMYWSIKNGRTPIFMTSSNDLLSDIYRDINDCGLNKYINPFYMMSDGEQIVDKKHNQVLVDKVSIQNTKHQFLDNSATSIPNNCILTTYSQINRLIEPKNNRKNKPVFFEDRLNNRAKWLSNFLQNNNCQLILDESHNVASVTSNQAKVLEHMTKHTKNPVIRSSATWSKDANNIAQCADLFPSNFTSESLRQMVINGGTPLQEVLSTVLIAEGAMVRREHNFGKRRVDIIESTQTQRNRIATDAMAEIMQLARNYASKQFSVIQSLNRFKTDYKNIEEYSFASSFGLISEGFTNAMRAETVADAAINAILNKEKPIIGVDKTAETALRYLYDILKENNNTDEVVVDAFPDFKAMLHRWITNEGIRKIKLKVAPTYDEIMAATLRGEVAKDSIVIEKIHWRDELSRGSFEYQQLEEMENALLNEVNKMPELPLSPIDFVKTKLAKSDISIAEVSGRSLHVRLHEDGIRYVIEPRTKEDKAQAQFEFNTNKKDAIILTRSGTEGISLHAQADLAKYDEGALNRRHIMLMGSFFYVIDEEQFFGRGERKGQATLARSSKIVTGMPIEARLLALSERNRLKLSASTTGNSQSIRSTQTIPNIMNKFGDEVVAEYLNDNPSIIDLLGFEEGKKNAILEFGSNSFKSNQISSLSGAVLGRMMLLDYQQQNAFLDEITQFYHSKLTTLQAKGIDPLNTKTIRGKVTVLKENVLAGKALAHYDSEFDKPVIVQSIDVQYPSIKVSPDVIENNISLGQRKLDAITQMKNSSFTDLALSIMGVRDEILERKLIEHNQTSVGFLTSNRKAADSIFKTVNEALAHKGFNRVKQANENYNKLIEFLNITNIGNVHSMDVEDNNALVITALQTPSSKGKLLELWQYSVEISSTRGEQAKSSSLETFLAMTRNPEEFKASYRGTYTRDHAINEKLNELSLSGHREHAIILCGNIIEAARLNSEKRIGTQIVIQDNETGNFYPAIRAKKDLTMSAILRMNFNATQEAHTTLIDYFNSDLAQKQLFVFDHVTTTTTDGDKKQGIIQFGTFDSGFSVKLPKTKTGRMKLGVPDPFNGLEYGTKGLNKRSNLSSTYLFHGKDLKSVLEILSTNGFNIQLSSERLNAIQEQIVTSKNTSLLKSHTSVQTPNIVFEENQIDIEDIHLNDGQEHNESEDLNAFDNNWHEAIKDDHAEPNTINVDSKEDLLESIIAASAKQLESPELSSTQTESLMDELAASDDEDDEIINMFTSRP